MKSNLIALKKYLDDLELVAKNTLPHDRRACCEKAVDSLKNVEWKFLDNPDAMKMIKVTYKKLDKISRTAPRFG